MKYSLNWLKEKCNNEERIKYLFFWGHQPSRDGQLTSACFSQWWTSNFKVDNITFKTAEHFMMAEKAKLFGDYDIYEKIISCNKPGEAKDLGRQVKNFNENTWLDNRYDIVLRGSINKFSQDDELKTFLLGTGDRVLVESSPIDKIWGIGMTADNLDIENPHKWNGLNLLGFALMETRDKLNESNCNPQQLPQYAE